MRNIKYYLSRNFITYLQVFAEKMNSDIDLAHFKAIKLLDTNTYYVPRCTHDVINIV